MFGINIDLFIYLYGSQDNTNYRRTAKLRIENTGKIFKARGPHGRLYVLNSTTSIVLKKHRKFRVRRGLG